MSTLPIKKIIITGVTKGLGRALLDGFQEAGYVVAGCGRTESEIYYLQKTYPHCYFKTLDIADSKQVMQWAEELKTQIGKPDLLINNAAIINHPAKLWEISETEFHELINTNIIGIWNAIRAFVPEMLSANSGVIVNMSSGWGHVGAAHFGPYCLSKFAVEGLTQSLAAELPSGMAAIALSPGMVNTLMLKKSVPEAANKAPTPEVWARKALAFLMNLGPKDNGKSLEIS